MQNKTTFEDIKSKVSSDEFRSTLEKLDREKTIQKFNISLVTFSKLVQLYEATDIIEKLKQQKRRAAYEKKATIKQLNLQQQISKDDLVNYYIEENHSVSDTAQYFNTSDDIVLQLIKIYNCKKPKTISNIISNKTKELKYGSSSYNNRDKAKQTCLEKYGVENPAQVTEFMKNSYDIKCLRYGKNNSNNWKQGHKTRIQNSVTLENSYKLGAETREHYCLEHYGVNNTSKLDSIKDKIKESVKETFQKKYGVDCYWLTDHAVRSNSSKNSSYNINFANALDSANISYKREVPVGRFIYDFQVGTNLIEINPTPTHNINWNPYSETGISKDYHQQKSLVAEEHGYRCIHIWDWDDVSKIIHLTLSERKKIYARQCTINEVSFKDARDFINTYHLQGYARDTIRIGLFYNDQLCAIMTFGKPRYNLKYEYELIRYCSSLNIVGGAAKLFNKFITEYNPSSIISYCDRSKFQGNVYNQLGFKYEHTTLSTHWYNMKTKQHILESLLRSRGFDQLFGTNFGKGTSNKELMLQHGFVEIVDCGQALYSWKQSNS